MRLGQVAVQGVYRLQIAYRHPILSGGHRLAAVTALTDATFNQALSAPQAVVEFHSPT